MYEVEAIQEMKSVGYYNYWVPIAVGRKMAMVRVK